MKTLSCLVQQLVPGTRNNEDLATCLLNIIQFRLFSHLYFHPRPRIARVTVHEYYTSRGEYHGWPNNHCLHCLFWEEPMATQLAQDQARQSMSLVKGIWQPPQYYTSMAIFIACIISGCEMR